MRRILRDLIGVFFPFHREPDAPPTDGGGTAVETPEAGDTGAGEGDNPALAAAASLEAANTRISELQSQNAELAGSIEARAEQMLNEVMPDVGDLSRSAPPPPTPPRQEAFEIDGERVNAEDLTPEQVATIEIQQLQQRVRGMEDQQVADRLNMQLDGYQQRFKHMDRHRIITFLGSLPDERAAQVNISKLCEISHQKEERKLNAYADEKIAAKLAEISGGAQPPPVPGQGAADPVETSTPKSWKEAKTTLVEKLRARGFGS